MRRKRPIPNEHRPSIWDRRTRVLAAAMVLFAVVLALWTARKNATGAAPATAASSGEAAGGGLTPGFFHVNDSASAAPPPPATPPDPPPVLDGITLEKTEVCSGEENLVTVHAHTVNGTDPMLHYVIDGQMGQSVPVKLWRGDNGGVVGKHSITVFGRGNVATTVPLPDYEVKDCRPTYVAAIRQRVRANTWADFDFEAKVIAVPPKPDNQQAPPPPKPFKAASYAWDFGDGDSVTTLTPVVEHSYETREQKALYSYFVVGVTIRGAKGEKATGRLALPLINPAFEALAQKGIVQLLFSFDPRFPEIGADGKVTQHVHIWHTRPDPVTIEQAVLVAYYRQGAGQTPPQPVDVGQLLGTSTIPAGKEGVTVTVVLDPQSEEEVFSKTWSLRGKSAEGNPVMGSFSVMRPPEHPSADAGTRVFDPMLKQKILAAREILGRDTVNDDDLWRLEREGMFDKLPKPSPEETAAAASAAIADAIQKGPPTQQGQQGRGAPAPTSTSQQAAPSAQGTGGTSPPASSAK